MPAFYFYCDTCKTTISKLMHYKDAKSCQIKCEVCNKSILTRAPTTPYTVTKEIIDNGIMPRRIEQYSDSNELIEDREKKDRANKSNKGI